MDNSNKYLNQFLGKNSHDILDIIATTPIAHCLCDSGGIYGYNYENKLLPANTSPISYDDGFSEINIPLHNLDYEFSFNNISLYLSMQVNKFYDKFGIYFDPVFLS